MNKYITYTKDVIGYNYLTVKYSLEEVNPFLNRLKDHLGAELFEEYTTNQQTRDRNSHHMTVINVMDFNRLTDELGPSVMTDRVQKLLQTPITDIKLTGVGTAQKAENTTFFVVVSSQMLNDVRTSFNLPEHDFHITLGFRHKDVFGVRKNKVMDSSDSKLHKMLRRDFQDRHNLEFLKRHNWPLDPDKEIIPVRLTDSILELITDDTLIGISSVEDGKGGYEYRIVYMTPDYDKTQKRIPLTELIEYLKK